MSESYLDLLKQEINFDELAKDEVRKYPFLIFQHIKNPTSLKPLHIHLMTRAISVR